MKTGLHRVSVATEEFSPRVLRCILFTQGMNYPQGYRLNERDIFDYELEFFVESTGSMLIDDKVYPIRPGDIVFRKPGQTTQGIMPYCCYAVFFDLLGNTGKNADTYDINEDQEFQNFYLNDVLDSIPTIYHPTAGDRYQYLFDGILREFIRKDEGSALLMKSYVLQILYQLYREAKNPLAGTVLPQSPHFSLVKRSMEFIQKNLQNKIALSQLSSLSGLSPNYFHRIFTHTLGTTPNGYITALRLEKVKEMLVKTDVPVSEIALQCGFDNIPYFSCLFKKHLNLSPGEFRKKHSII